MAPTLVFYFSRLGRPEQLAKQRVFPVKGWLQYVEGQRTLPSHSPLSKPQNIM